jgi:hypothetical protein
LGRTKAQKVRVTNRPNHDHFPTCRTSLRSQRQVFFGFFGLNNFGAAVEVVAGGPRNPREFEAVAVALDAVAERHEFMRLTVMESRLITVFHFFQFVARKRRKSRLLITTDYEFEGPGLGSHLSKRDDVDENQIRINLSPTSASRGAQAGDYEIQKGCLYQGGSRSQANWTACGRIAAEILYQGRATVQTVPKGSFSSVPVATPHSHSQQYPSEPGSQGSPSRQALRPVLDKQTCFDIRRQFDGDSHYEVLFDYLEEEKAAAMFPRRTSPGLQRTLGLHSCIAPSSGWPNRILFSSSPGMRAKNLRGIYKGAEPTCSFKIHIRVRGILKQGGILERHYFGMKWNENAERRIISD